MRRHLLGIWLPIVDAFRTFAVCPPPDMAATLRQIQSVLLHKVSATR